MEKTIRRAKALLAVVVLAFVVLSLVPKKQAVEPYESVANKATFALFDGNNSFYCSGSTIGKNAEDAIGVTARHCIVDEQTNEIRPVIYAGYTGNEQGPYYIVTPLLISADDDVAIISIRNGADRTIAGLGDENSLRSGDPIFNVSFPRDAGKLTFHGEFLSPRYPHVPRDFVDEFDGWKNSMPVNLTFAPGSSGSGVYSLKQRALIGVAVGNSGTGSFNVVEPVSVIVKLIEHPKENSIELWKKNHPKHEAPDVMIMFGDEIE